MTPDSIKVPKMWAGRSQETLEVRAGDGPGENGWEMLVLPLQLCHGQQLRGWERVCKA